jgi:sugar lactone lactonase YvrE
MRSFGRLLLTSPAPTRTSLVRLAAAALVLAATASFAQTAPQLLPYTMSTYAGPNAAPGTGTKCGNYTALDPVGDGCPALNASVGPDPHDIRVDGKGNVYWLDNLASSITLVHKINPFTKQVTIQLGNDLAAKSCTGGSTLGYGCTATDGAANALPPGATLGNTLIGKNYRGLGVDAQGDIFLAGYNEDYVHEISASTGLFTNIAGTGAASTTYTGPALSTPVASVRGVGVDSYGNVYIAETANNIVVVDCVTVAANSPCTSASQIGNLVQLTATNTASAKVLTAGVLATSQQLDAPEDVQIDSNGNIYIADQGNGLLRAIYEGKGSLPGVTGPLQTGYIYNIAGNGAVFVVGSNGSYTNSPYSSAFTPVVLATNVAISLRKISIDARNNIYIADTSQNVVWFIDNATGYMRLLAGQLGPANGTAAPGCPAAPTTATNTVGDGCPGPLAALDFNYGGSNTDGANAVDNQGNLYITDAEGGSASTSRIRKLLSGLDFPAATVGVATTQTLFLHFGVADSFSTATSSNADFTVGTQTCNTNSSADNTSDCTLPITFKPVNSGADTAVLTVTSSKGLVSTFQVIGTGIGPQFVIDPGNLVTSGTTFSNPQDIFVDGNNITYIADTGNNRVLYSVKNGTPVVLAGSPTGTPGSSGDGGLATAALLSAPSAVTVDAAHNIYIADTGNNRIRKINAANGVITTFAGGGAACSAATDAFGDFCPATSATLSAPAGVAADNLGNVYISDTGNSLIRQVSVSGIITKLAGGGTGTCTNTIGTPDTQGDGCAASATVFAGPTNLAFDPVGNFLFVADTGHSTIRKIFLGTSIPTTASSPYYTAASVQQNTVTLVAGNGSAGSSPNTLATLAQLNKPTGVYVDAAENVYIADTQNSAVRLVDSATGDISTIAGIIGTSGLDATLPSTATDAQLNLPSAIAIANGVLSITDAANNRILGVFRSNITYNFGAVNVPTTGSPVVTFTQTSTGNAAATLANPAYVASGDSSQFLFSTPGASTGCTATGSYAPGTFCQYTGQFIPTAAQPTPYSAVYTETGANPPATPSINLIGTGAVQTATNPVVSQTSPTGSPQYGQPVSLTITVTPSSCNLAAPSCNPTGSVRFVINGTPGTSINIPAGTNTVTLSNVTSLIYGPNQISCTYSGDFYYAAGSCPTVVITVTQANTTSRLAVTGSGQVQFPSNNCVVISASGFIVTSTCTDATLTAQITSSTIGIPSGTVTFFYAPASGGTPVPFINGTNIPINNATGQANLLLQEIVNGAGVEISNNTLPPGSYTLTCQYNGANDYAVSNCPGVPFTVIADAPGYASIMTRGCSITTLSLQGTVTPLENGSCSPPGAPTVEQKYNGIAEISTADGASTDASIFISPTNTLTGTLTFSCSGLPQYTACTFSPTSIALTPGTGHIVPVYTDVTIFTDVPPGNVGALNKPAFGRANTITLAQLGISSTILWPFSAFALFALFRLRRRLKSLRGIALLGLALLLSAGSLGLNGCAGPGAYKAALTPASPNGVPYLITVNITNGTASTTTTFYLNITAPGITGQQ